MPRGLCSYVTYASSHVGCIFYRWQVSVMQAENLSQTAKLSHNILLG